MKKLILLSATIGAAIFVASSAQAVPGVLTVSGTALYQGTNSQGDSVVKRHGITQKDLLIALAQATGDGSITNSKTKIYYDPDAFNNNATNSGYYFYGTFYYSNSVAGLTALDGVDTNGAYYSYIEFDYINGVTGDTEGFWQPGSVEYNNILAISPNHETANGNGILYIHSNPYDYNLPGNYTGGLGYPPYYYYANDYYGFYQQYALVMHGMVNFTVSLTSNQATETESFKISGSGDGVWDYNDIVVDGKGSFTGKGPNDL